MMFKWEIKPTFEFFFISFFPQTIAGTASSVPLNHV